MSLTLPDMVKKLSGKIKMEFEVERLDPAVSPTEAGL